MLTDSPSARLGVKRVTHALEHLVRHDDGEGELEGVPVEAVLPLGLLVRVEAADEDVVVPAVDGPRRDGVPGALVFEVRGRPEREGGRLEEPVRRRQELAALERRLGYPRLEVREREGVLEPFLVA